MRIRAVLLAIVVFSTTACLEKKRGILTSGDGVKEPITVPPPAGKLTMEYPTGAGIFIGKARLVASITEIQAPNGTWKVTMDGGTACSGSLGASDVTGTIRVDCHTAAPAGTHQMGLSLYNADGTLSVSLGRTVKSATDTCAGSLPNSADLTAPPTLSQTCLYDNLALNKISESMRPFTPQFNLFGDSAVKRRWAYLPPGTQIDTTDPENWVFPNGTRFFKEFRHDGKLVETRMLVKTAAAAGAASWVASVYAWRADQSEADLQPAAVPNALGTFHDIPATANCGSCHNGAKDFVLGFDAIQLSKASPFEETSFSSLRADALITNNPGKDYAIAGTPAQQKAIGYLHANCSHCHNPLGSQAALNFNFKHNLDAATHLAENAYVTGLAQAKIIAGSPATSPVVIRMSARPGMPPIGTKIVDSSGLAVIREWILGL